MINRSNLMAAMAALLALDTPQRTPRYGTGRTWVRPQTAPSRRGLSREKYPGQHSAYLRGAWRPMTYDEIDAHNRGVDAQRGGQK